MKLLKPLIAILFAGIFATGCDKDENIPVSRVANLTGANSVPANAATGTGVLTYSYNPATKTLTYSVNYNGLTGNPTNNATTGSGIYGPASAGAVGTLLLPITFPTGTSGTVSGTLYIDGYAIKESNLLAGMYYINIKTAANASGEIRAQLTF